MKKVFIDGSAGTTGLRIFERLSKRNDIALIELPEEKRKDPKAREEALNRADVAFLCLPDEAARESVSLVHNPETVILDTSTAHRTCESFVYGFPELSKEHRSKIASARRIAVPGCHASGFISLIAPLIRQKVLSPEALLSCFSITGYSGGGKKMIAEYQKGDRNAWLDSPRQYGLSQLHKHLPEITAITRLKSAPIFSPIVADYYSGMAVTVPLFSDTISGTAKEIREIYQSHYTGPVVRYVDSPDENGFLAANRLAGKDSMEVTVAGNEDRILLISRYDNLGKGASGAAIQCMNLVLGLPETQGLII